MIMVDSVTSTFLKTEPHFVAYIDILGAKKIIETDKDYVMLNLIHKCISDCIDQVQTGLEMSDIPDSKIKIFSDNILVAIPSSFNMVDAHHPVIAMNRMETTANFIQKFFLSNNILSRGGVTFGDLYIDDTLVWGSALLKAYSLENSIAIYPRIVIDDVVVDIANSIELDYEGETTLELHRIKSDFDGVYFFDYLNYPADPRTQNVIHNSLVHTEQRLRTETNPRILQKLNWHKNYLLACKSTSR